MIRLLLGLAAAATAACAAQEPAYRELPPEAPPAAARAGADTPAPAEPAARLAVQGLTAFCQSLTTEQHAAAVEWSNENRGRENNERLGELTWKIGQAGTSATPVIQARLPLADKWERCWLLVGLAKLADPHAIATFETYAQGEDDLLRGRAFDGLCACGPASLAALARLAGHRDDPVREGAARALNGILEQTRQLAADQRKRIVEIALPFLTDRAAFTRLVAVGIVAHGGADCDDAMIAALGDAEPSVRQQALEAVVARKQTSALPALIESIDHPRVPVLDILREPHGFMAEEDRATRAVAAIAGLTLPPLADCDWGSGMENKMEGYRESLKRTREDVMNRAAFVRQWWNEKGRQLYDRKEADQPRGEDTPAPPDSAVRRRLVDAVNVSYRLAAEARPAPPKAFRYFVASTNGLRLPRKEDVRAYENSRPWARPYEPAVGKHAQSGVEDKETAWPGAEHAADLRKLLGDPDADIRCMAAEALATLRCPEDVEPLRRLLRDPALGPPTLVRNFPATAGPLDDDELDVDGFRMDRSWVDLNVAQTVRLALGRMTGETSTAQWRGWLRQLSHAERAKRREAADILAAVDDRTGETFVALAEALANEIRTANPGTGQVGGDFEELEARLASLLVRFGAKADITTLARPLQEDNPRLRLTFAGILRDLGMHARPAVPSLVGLLGDRDTMVRMTAADALWRTGDRGAEPALMKAAGDRDLPVRYHAVEALREMGTRSAVPVLAQRLALADEDWIVREAAARALGRIGSPESLAALVETVRRDVHPSVCKAAIAGIANIGGSPAAAALEGFVDTRPTLFGNEPIEALGSMASPEGDAALVRLLRSGGGVVRFHAARALGRKGNAAAMEALAGVLLTDKEPWIRKEAAESLGRTGERAAIPSLKRALDDGNWEVRCGGAGVLGELGDSAGLALTVAEAGHEDYVRRCQAVQALGRIGGPAALAALRAGLKDADDSVRRDAARELGRLGDSESAGVLTALLRDESREVRYCAAGALTVLGHAECLPALRKSAEDTDLALREVAMDAIRVVEAREVLKNMVARLTKVDAVLAWDLRDLATTSSVTPVIRNLGRHCDPQIRGWTVDFIGKAGGMDDIAFLEKMRRDPDPTVREAAAAAINEVRDRQPRPSPIEPCVERSGIGETPR